MRFAHTLPIHYYLLPIHLQAQPAEGKVSAKPTDEVFSEAHLYCTYTYIASARPESAAKPAQRATDGRPYE